MTDRLRVTSFASLIITTLCLVHGLASAAFAQPTAKEILRNASRHYDVVRDYTANVKVSVDSPSLQMPEMLVKMYFKKPDKLHMESRDGFALVPKQSLLTGNPLNEFFANSDISLAHKQQVLGSDCYVVKAVKETDGILVRSTVWIDSKSWLVRQLHIVPEQGPVMKVKIWYVRVGKYWMPATTSAQISLPPFPGARPEDAKKPDKPTIVTMKFSDYRVNRGLSDEIFEKQKGSK